MKNFLRISAIVVALLLMLWGGVYAWQSHKNHLKVKEMLATAANRPRGERPNREEFAAFRKEVDALPKAYQKEFRDGMRDRFQDMMQERLNNYFKLSKEDRIKELDKRIAEEEQRRIDSEKRRKEREAQRATASAAGGSGGNGSGGRGGAGANAQGGDQGSGGGQVGRGDGGQGGPGGSGPGGPGGFGGGRGLAARLDNTSPMFRAQMAQMRIDMAQRRAQLGLPPRTSRRNYL